MKTLPGVVLLSLLALPLFPQEVLSLTLKADEAAADSAAGTIPLRLTIANVSDATVSGIGLTLDSNFTFVSGVILQAPAWTCSGAPNYLQCEYSGAIDAKTEITLDAVMRFPARSGRARLRVFVSYGGARRTYGDLEEVTATMWRRFIVTRTDDAGEGTLRGAIQAVNAEPICATLPCLIELALPPPAAGGWSTIQPLTPFAALVAGDVEVDGTTQADTNPLGPDVALIGTTLSGGNGLDIRARRMSVRGLAIAGFPDSGIFYFPTARGSKFTIEKNYVGVDPTGTRAIANGARGVTIAEGIVQDSAIRDNVISGNFRSGIFLVTLEEPALPLGPVLTIARNRIGLAAASDTPIPNGASGVFVGPNAQQVLISDNVIAHNGQFGLAVSHTATWVRLGSNRIFGHPLPAIDFGLDGPSAAPGLLPVLESARYDAASDTTTIAGRGPIPTFSSYTYAFYANDTIDAAGYAEAEQFLGNATAQIEHPARADGRFSLLVMGDLRGKYVNAATTEILNLDGSLMYRSGELLRAIRVE